MITKEHLNSTELEDIISKKRLSTYNDDLSLYIFNAKLSENFFLLLQNLEVGLRNSIYNACKLKSLYEISKEFDNFNNIIKKDNK